MTEFTEEFIKQIRFCINNNLVIADNNFNKKALDEIEKLQKEKDNLRSTLQVVLDHVDYTSGACRMNEMVAAVLPVQIINLAKERLKGE